MDTELNMSPEANIRRKALYQKDEANKQFEEFKKKYQQDGENDGRLNLTLKKTA
jgi:hypothetical protein